MGRQIPFSEQLPSWISLLARTGGHHADAAYHFVRGFQMLTRGRALRPRWSLSVTEIAQNSVWHYCAGIRVSGRRGDPSFIVFTRYILLAVEARNELDSRTLGALFLAMCDDMTDIRYANAIALLL